MFQCITVIVFGVTVTPVSPGYYQYLKRSVHVCVCMLNFVKC